jgi:hypothetical protein
MKKKLLALVICLSFAFLAAGCTGGGNSPGVSLQQAQIAFGAVLLMGFDVTNVISSGTTLVNNTSELKKQNALLTLTYDKVPNDGTYTRVETVTAQSYLETGTGYLLNGTVVTSSASGTDSASSYDLTMSNSINPIFTVTSITGTLTNSSGVTTGSLSFNGVSYSYAELMPTP